MNFPINWKQIQSTPDLDVRYSALHDVRAFCGNDAINPVVVSAIQWLVLGDTGSRHVVFVDHEGRKHTWPVMVKGRLALGSVGRSDKAGRLRWCSPGDAHCSPPSQHASRNRCCSEFFSLSPTRPRSTAPHRKRALKPR